MSPAKFLRISASCAISLCSLILIAWGPTARAETLELPRLMQLLAAAPASEVAFSEKKFSSLLATPVISSGRLVYRRPDTVEKNIDLPKKERYVFTGDELIVTRNGADRRIPLSSQPLLSAFAASLRGTLGGNLPLLKSFFELTLQGDEQSWRLDMIPVDKEISRYVSRVTASGKSGMIAQIEVREASGDHSVMQIR
ncbi:MAG: LolA-related protein [Betaproteobacteria bacterium]